MPSDFNHGVRVLEVNSGSRTARTVETSIIGMVCTAEDADSSIFPLNKPVQLVGASGYLDKAGEKGTLARALDAIKDQCEPIIHVIRVAEGDTEAETISNIIGGNVAGQRTGLQALLTSKVQFGDKARILGVPFWDKKQAIAIELDIISEKLRAFNYCGVDAESIEAATQYRTNFGSRRKMLIWPEFTGWDTVTNSEQLLYASARALGLRARIDNEIGWHKTISNVEVKGVEGISYSLFHDPTSTDPTETRLLNSKEVTTLIRDNGFKFWGNRNCAGSSSLFPFENYTRTADVLADTMAMGHLWATDQPMSVGLLKDVIYTARSKLLDLTTMGYLLGGNAWFDGDFNPKELIKAGRATIDYDYTPVPPMEDLLFQQRITDRHIVSLIQQASAI
jgi:hypothetical protein